jgi:hypothetical protein
VPVLEIWQPPLRKSKLTREFPQRPKLGAKDIYATLNEPYITRNLLQQRQGHLEDHATQPSSDSNAQEKDIIAAMCNPSNNDNPITAIHFRDTRCIWQANAGSAGSRQSTSCYRFVIKNEHDTTCSEQCRMIMQWEKRTISAKANGVPGTPDNEHFVLVAIDRKARRKSRIATMNRGGFEITVRKSSILEHLRTCLALTDPVSAGGNMDSVGELETWLYTLVLTLGISVASQEGWLG